MGTAGAGIIVESGAMGIKSNFKGGIFDASGAGCDCCSPYDCSPLFPTVPEEELFVDISSLAAAVSYVGAPDPTFSNGLYPTLNPSVNQTVKFEGFPLIPESSDFTVEFDIEVTRHTTPIARVLNVTHSVNIQSGLHSDFTAIEPTGGEFSATIVRQLSTSSSTNNFDSLRCGTPGNVFRSKQLGNYFHTIKYRQYDKGTQIAQEWWESGTLVASANRAYNTGANPKGYQCARVFTISISATATFSGPPVSVSTTLPVVKAVRIAEA